MATTVTTPALRQLAGFRAENGCAISIYVDLDPSSFPTSSDIHTKFHAMLVQAEKEGERRSTGRECRLALREDAKRITRWWEDDFDRDGARGVAIFASSADSFFQGLTLPDPPGDSAQVSARLHLAPLVGQFGHDGDLVAVVSRERGTVYRFEAGRLVEVLDETDEQPGQHDQGGWSQARYQRHIEQLVQQHLKAVGAELDKTLPSGSGLQLVVVAPEEVRSELEKELSHATRDAVIGWATAEAHAGPSELLAVVRPIFDEARARRDQETLERWREAHGRGERSATGWKQTLEAASDARVEVLLVEEQPERQAWECPSCGRAYADGGKCPLDGTKLEEEPDGADLAIHQTLLHGGSVVRLGAGARDDAPGIAALLRF